MMKQLFMVLVLLSSNFLIAQVNYSQLEMKEKTVIDYTIERYDWTIYRSLTPEGTVYGVTPDSLRNEFLGIDQYVNPINATFSTNEDSYSAEFVKEAYALPSDSCYVQYALYDRDKNEGALRIMFNGSATTADFLALGFSKVNGNIQVTGFLSPGTSFLSFVKYLSPSGIYAVTNMKDLRELQMEQAIECTDLKVAYMLKLDCLAQSILSKEKGEINSIVQKLNSK
ncbi:hypothetical protein [Lewinella sp. 4G2]|uniref:hypothetical protein n=1 Tax=Lewinella sp. 4G2 TaxID=1803372 RepID=UPI0007B4758A|nr:hypothetical protein [Lewinella sp. 4G2]OAV43832.1 hypothetical protein A3850_004655 [Lewinella sp. 4G2]